MVTPWPILRMVGSCLPSEGGIVLPRCMVHAESRDCWTPESVPERETGAEDGRAVTPPAPRTWAQEDITYPKLPGQRHLQSGPSSDTDCGQSERCCPPCDALDEIPVASR